MTISNTSRTAGPFAGNGITNQFPFSYKVYKASDLLVALTTTSTGVEKILTLDGDYTVTLNNDQNSSPGGMINMIVAPAVGTSLAATSNLPIEQTLDLTNNGGFYPKVINDALDKLAINIQELRARIGAGSLNVGAAAQIASVISFITDASAAAGSSLFGYIQSGIYAVKRTIQDRLRDSFHAKDYGLKGDGVTSDRTALNNLVTYLNSRGRPYEIVFSDGDYLIDSSMTIGSLATLNFSSGGILKISGGALLTFDNCELKAGLHKIFIYAGGTAGGSIRNALIFPEWWGAIADGLHPPVGSDFSDRAAAAARNSGPLQAALNFAGYKYATNGLTGTVQLTYGFYVYDTPLNIPLSVNLVGYGIGSALFYYGATGNAVQSISTNNSLLSDFFIAPIAGPTWNVSTGYGLYMDGVSTPAVRNVWSSGFMGGCFFFRNVIEGRIYGLISDNSNGPAFVFRGVGQGTVVENCVTAGTDNGACFDIQSGYDWHFIGCTAKDGPLGTNGFYLNAVENINMTNCGCHAINKEGFLLTSSVLNSTFVSCFVNDASALGSNLYDAISISGTRNKFIAPKVTGNTPAYRYGIFLGGAATDCDVESPNVTPGVSGYMFEGQPIGTNRYKTRKYVTSNTTPVTMFVKQMNNNAGCYIEATVAARQAAGESATFKISAYAVTSSSGTTLTAPTITAYKSNGASAIAATLSLLSATANAGQVGLVITGLAGNPVNWEAEVMVMSVTG